jgi:CBS domain containing-hemolysin-like protein
MAEGYRLLLVAVIIATNGFFASAEVALLSTRKSRLRQLADNGNVGAQAAVSLLANPERLLSVVQVGVTLASLGLGWAGEETIYGMLHSALYPLVTPATERVVHYAAFAVSFAIITYLHVVLGEVVPKNLAIEKADRLAIIVSPVLLVFYRISEPFVAAIEKSATAISRLIGLSGETHGGGHSAEELRYIISMSRRELNEFARETMGRVLDLGDYYAREIMVPRTSVISVSVDATLDQVLKLFLEHLYSRMPVYEGKPENIIGVLHFKDLIRVWEERRSAQEVRRPSRPFRLRRIMRKALVVPETKPVNQLISDFRANHTHIAIVVDEFGTISGLVTLEDALEQIFGELEDEHDETRQHPRVEADEFEIEGTTSIRDLETIWGIQLPGDAGFETLAGFLLFKVGAIPKVGDTVEHDGRRFVIEAMDRNRIARVRVEKTAQDNDSSIM